MEQSNYLKYRGKCKEFCEAAILKDPTLTLVRGHYYQPMWNRDEQHWWTVKTDGTIHDPTRLQFPSAGTSTYTPFDGTVECVECGEQMLEDEASYYGNYAFCSNLCMGKFVGVF